MTLFYLIRHGETEWNRHGNRYCGRTNLPLAQAGRVQADALAASLQNVRFDAVLVSPLQRAQETAHPIAKQCGMEMKMDERLREIDFGDWEGLTQQEIEQHFPNQWEQWIQDPTAVRAGGCGESANDVFSRMKSVIVENSKDNLQRILIVSHNTAIRLFFVGTFGMPFTRYRNIEIDNAGLKPRDVNEDVNGNSLSEEVASS
ncbi:MAG: histidine phosphatase family protein [Firmicutes bacterium]|nr:histidine phosphatase family protein [Bacillota bacterium]